MNPFAEKYLPGEGLTHCNLFVFDVMTELGVHIPLRLANEQLAWLDSLEGAGEGWDQCSATEAVIEADLGRPVIAGWINPGPPPHNHGHIACVTPGPDPRVYISQAGSRNFIAEPLSHGFGNLPVKFWKNS